MEGLHIENFDFYFLHWFMQCPTIFYFWCVAQRIRRLPLWISMPHNGLHHSYFIETLPMGMVQI